MISLAFFSIPGLLVLVALLLFLLPAAWVKRGAGGLAHKLGRMVGGAGGAGWGARRPQDRPPVLEYSAAALEEKYKKILGLAGNITPEDLKRRWRELSRQYHPDQVHHLGPKLRAVAEREMKDINAAYEYLRKKYGV
jgi:hypothetical protein